MIVTSFVEKSSFSSYIKFVFLIIMILEFVIDVVTLIGCFWFYNLEVISSVIEGTQFSSVCLTL